MIKHEEARENLNYLYGYFGEDIPRQYILEQYIEQQEKKDALIELYKEYFQIVESGDNDWHYRMNEIPEQIKALEEVVE